MKTPKGLQPLIDDGIIDHVVRSQSSKGMACAKYRCAKVYKEAEQRGFHKLAHYQEASKVRGSRGAIPRAMGRGGRHGRSVCRKRSEDAEVEALYRLVAAGVRVPQPYGVFDGAIVMEVVCDAIRQSRPRLNDVEVLHTGRGSAMARVHDCADRPYALRGAHPRRSVRLQCATGFCRSGDHRLAASRERGRQQQRVSVVLERDVDNMREAFGRAAPDFWQPSMPTRSGSSTRRANCPPESPLTGRFEHDRVEVDVVAVLDLIEDERLLAETAAPGGSRRRSLKDVDWARA